MKQPSIFVSALIVIVGGVAVLSAFLMGQPIAAVGLLLLFSLFWAALQFVGRGGLVSPKARWYFRFIVLIGAISMPAVLWQSIDQAIDGQYSMATRSLGVFAILIATAWRYRKEWKSWVL